MKIIKLAIIVIIFPLTNCNQSNLWENLNTSVMDSSKTMVAPTVETLVPAPASTFLPLNKIIGTSFEAGGDILNPGSSSIIGMGVCLSEDNINFDDCLSAETISGNMFKVHFTGMVAEKDYYVKAYADNGSELFYGSAIRINSGYQIGVIVDGDIVLQNDGSGGGLLVHENDPSVIVKKTWSEAIHYCDNLISIESNQWFLPSKKELLLIKENLIHIYPSNKYWSSDEEFDNTPTRSYSINFNDGFIDLCDKTHEHFVLPIRKF